MPFVFATAIDNACPLDARGVRVDQMDRSGHYARWEEDFDLARSLGFTAMRYGPAYYRTHVGPDHFDWDVAEEPMQRLQTAGITVIAELCRFGVPSWLGGFLDPAFPVLFAEYARAFARRYPWIRYYTPVSEIFRCARMSALEGQWNECAQSEADFVRAVRNLCMAHELAVEGILAERPDAIIVQSESVEHVHPAGRGAVADADRWNVLRFLPLDLTVGAELPPGVGSLLNEHGVTSNDLSFFRERRGLPQRRLGLVYGHDAERRLSANGRLTVAHDGLGFARLASEYHRRFRLPLMHYGASHPVRGGAAWLASQWEDVLSLRAAGTPLHGFTWSSLVDHVELVRAEAPGTGDRCVVESVGLFTVARTASPLADEVSRLIRKWAPVVVTRDGDRAIGGG